MSRCESKLWFFRSIIRFIFSYLSLEFPEIFTFPSNLGNVERASRLGGSISRFDHEQPLDITVFITGRIQSVTSVRQVTDACLKGRRFELLVKLSHYNRRAFDRSCFLALSSLSLSLLVSIHVHLHLSVLLPRPDTTRGVRTTLLLLDGRSSEQPRELA